jgi:hypothetical protein
VRAYAVAAQEAAYRSLRWSSCAGDDARRDLSCCGPRAASDACRPWRLLLASLLWSSIQRDERADENREHYREPGQALTAEAAEEEGKPERDCGQCVAEVVDQICEQRDAERPGVDERLRECGH